MMDSMSAFFPEMPSFLRERSLRGGRADLVPAPQPLITDFLLNGKLARRPEILEFIRISLRATLAQQFSLLSLQCYLFFFLCHMICKGLALGEQCAIRPACGAGPGEGLPGCGGGSVRLGALLPAGLRPEIRWWGAGRTGFRREL